MSSKKLQKREQEANLLENSSEKFSIDLLPIQDQNRKFLYLSNFSLVNNLTKEKLQEL